MGLGIKVSKVWDPTVLTPFVDPLFDVTGRVLMTLLFGEVVTGLATVTTLQLKVGVVALNSATTITSDVAGTIYWHGGDTGAIMNGGDAPVVGIGSQANVAAYPNIIGILGGALTINAVADQAGTGAVLWNLWYFPLDIGAKVVAAA